jgi:hypothetical protein
MLRKHLVSSVLEIKRYPSGTTANIQDGTATADGYFL